MGETFPGLEPEDISISSEVSEQSEEAVSLRPEQQQLESKSDQIFERTYEAAEHDQLIEQAYERRAEIKDNPDGEHTGPVPIATVLSQSLQRVPLTAKERKQLAKAVERAHKRRHHSLYGQAVRGGFWGAVVIAVISILLIYGWSS